MLVGALIDAGAAFHTIAAGLKQLDVCGFNVRAEKVRKQGFAATQFHVDLERTTHEHRGLSEIRAIIDRSSLPKTVRDRSAAIFERLADSEAKVHGVDREQIHFHEVGAVDAIVDVVAAALAIEALGIDRIVCSPLAVGSGTVACAHGVMPVPAPATVLLLQGVPIAATQEEGELLTPTAAAILTTVAAEFGPVPSMTLESTGMGAGTREGKHLPNVVRVLVGTAEDDTTDTVAILESNLDDVPGEWVGHCMGRLLEAGALDVYCVPIYMKKSRPGVLLTVLADRARVAQLESIIFAETCTLGIRRRYAERSKLERSSEEVDTPYGRIRVKVGRRGGRTITAAAEYDECAAAARSHGVPLRAVMEAAMHAWRIAGNY